MKLIGRILWLLVGLIYRLIVLVLFERWIPFPERTAPEPPRRKRQKPPPTPRDVGADERAPMRRERERAAGMARANRRGGAREPAFFNAKSSELSPELAAQREGEHWLGAKPAHERARARAAQPESLRSLLRDKRALRDAVVLASALGTRRAKP